MRPVFLGMHHSCPQAGRSFVWACTVSTPGSLQVGPGQGPASDLTTVKIIDI